MQLTFLKQIVKVLSFPIVGNHKSSHAGPEDLNSAMMLIILVYTVCECSK